MTCQDLEKRTGIKGEVGRKPKRVSTAGALKRYSKRDGGSAPVPDDINEPQDDRDEEQHQQDLQRERKERCANLEDDAQHGYRHNEDDSDRYPAKNLLYVHLAIYYDCFFCNAPIRSFRRVGCSIPVAYPPERDCRHRAVNTRV